MDQLRLSDIEVKPEPVDNVAPTPRPPPRQAPPKSTGPLPFVMIGISTLFGVFLVLYDAVKALASENWSQIPSGILGVIGEMNLSQMAVAILGVLVCLGVCASLVWPAPVAKLEGAEDR
jgi:hypothetical protein